MVARVIGGIGAVAVVGSFVGAVVALIGGSSMLFVVGVVVGAVVGAVALGAGWLPRRAG